MLWRNFKFVTENISETMQKYGTLISCYIDIYKERKTVCIFSFNSWECSGSVVVECLTGDQGAAGSSLTGVTVLCP